MQQAINLPAVCTAKDHHAKFIPGTSRRQKMLLGHCAHHGRKALQIPVSCIMSIRVIDALEIIQIQHDKRAYFPVLALLQRLLCELPEMLVFVKSGEWIVRVLIPHPVFLHDVLRHIRNHAKFPRRGL